MTPPTSEQVADVALFLEGTYPYVLGGVSSWVDQIIRGLPELTFALFYLGSEKKPDQEVQYSLPSMCFPSPRSTCTTASRRRI